ncbi:hypothetical protein KKA24_02385 [Patescibacteria group bacterium]|nr:hypothetical protein [Patescibacteria group bacterium]
MENLLTIIDNKNLRGVIAPSKMLSKKLLEDVIDFIELSTPESIKESEERITEADHDNSWMSAGEIERKLKEREELSK